MTQIGHSWAVTQTPGLHIPETPARQCLKLFTVAKQWNQHRGRGELGHEELSFAVCRKMDATGDNHIKPIKPVSGQIHNVVWFGFSLDFKDT